MSVYQLTPRIIDEVRPILSQSQLSQHSDHEVIGGEMTEAQPSAVILRRLRDFPEVQALEIAALIDPVLCTQAQRFHNDRTDSVARAIFGVTALEVANWVWEPLTEIEDRLEQGDAVSEQEREAALDACDERQEQLMKGWEEEMDLAAYCRKFGWDVLNADGKVLLMAENLLSPLMAAVSGSAGAKLPPEGVETLAAWEAKLTAPKPRPRARGQTAATPISEAERRRRNEEARRSTVWRPAPRKA